MDWRFRPFIVPASSPLACTSPLFLVPRFRRQRKPGLIFSRIGPAMARRRFGPRCFRCAASTAAGLPARALPPLLQATCSLQLFSHPPTEGKYRSAACLTSACLPARPCPGGICQNPRRRRRSYGKPAPLQAGYPGRNKMFSGFINPRFSFMFIKPALCLNPRFSFMFIKPALCL